MGHAVADLPFVAEVGTSDLGRNETLVQTLSAHRARAWGAFSPRGLEVFRYKEAIRILRGKEFQTDLSALYTVVGLPADLGSGPDGKSNNMLAVNGPEHTKLRLLFTEFFSPNRVLAWRRDIVEIAERLLADARTGTSRFDLAQAVCHRLPAVLFCRMIGAPDEDAGFIQRMSDSLLKVFLADPSHRNSILQANLELDAYIVDLIAERRARPGDDFVSYFLMRQRGAGLTDANIVANVRMFLSASSENTGNQFAKLMIDLLQDPVLWNAVRANPDFLAPAADESIRLYPRVGLINRRCTTAAEINGVPIPKGMMVSVSVIAAQRDPDGLEDAGAFSLKRGGARPHLTFGGGAHYCIGTMLAKLEIVAGAEVIVNAVPNLRLSGPPEWTLLDRSMTVESIPVELGS